MKLSLFLSLVPGSVYNKAIVFARRLPCLSFKEVAKTLFIRTLKSLIGEGYKRKQAVAIAYSEAEKSNGKKDQLQEKPSRYKFSSAGQNYGETQQFPYL